MASDYGSNFGFRRSDESMAIAEGRFKTPATGAALLHGTAIEINPASAGYVKASAVDTVPTGGFHGLLVQEDSHLFGLYERNWKDTADLGVSKKNTLCIIRSGAGTKVWFRNTAQTTSPDGTVTPAVTMFTQGTIAVGTFLTWNGTVWIASTGVAGGLGQWMRVTHVETGYLEAVLTF